MEIGLQVSAASLGTAGAIGKYFQSLCNINVWHETLSNWISPLKRLLKAIVQPLYNRLLFHSFVQFTSQSNEIGNNFF